MRVVADGSRCVGSGQCVLTDPAAFAQNDEDGTVVVLRDRPLDEDAVARAREAVRLCPVRALSLAR